MASENVELVRSYFAALSGGRFEEIIEKLGPVMERLDPNFELDLSRSISPERGIYHGVDGIRQVAEARAEAWSRLESFETEIIDTGDVVVRVGGFRGVGEYSGLELSAEAATVWTFVDGRAVSSRLYQSRADALDAAGIEQ